MPTVSKAMAHNLGMFTTYEEVKERLQLIFPDSPSTVWFLSGVLAGCAAASLSLPFDNAKTKMQRQKKMKDGSKPYKHIFHAMSSEVKQNGPRGLWVGYPTYCLRICPHAMISFMVAENLKKVLY